MKEHIHLTSTPLTCVVLTLRHTWWVDNIKAHVVVWNEPYYSVLWPDGRQRELPPSLYWTEWAVSQQLITLSELRERRKSEADRRALYAKLRAEFEPTA